MNEQSEELTKLTKEQEKEVEELQADLWEWSKDHKTILEDGEVSLFIQGWKKGREREKRNQ